MTNTIKRMWASVLAVCMVMTLAFGAFPTKALADDPVTIKSVIISVFQSDDDWQGTEYVIYEEFDNGTKTVNNSALAGVTYDSSTNTLNLTNVNQPRGRLDITGMGKIKVQCTGVNSLQLIDCRGNWYDNDVVDTTLTIDGFGSLALNELNSANAVHPLVVWGDLYDNYNNGVYLNTTYAKASFELAFTVELKVTVEDDGPAIWVDRSSIEDGKEAIKLNGHENDYNIQTKKYGHNADREWQPYDADNANISPNYDHTITGSISVIPAYTVTPTLAAATISEGATTTISAKTFVGSTEISSPVYTYESDNAAVATVDASGNITGVGGGTATITVTDTAHNNTKGTAAVTVTALPVVIFDPQGGVCDTPSMKTNSAYKLASLPVATKDGNTFNGWFDAPTGGNQITTDTVFATNTTVYAQWTENAPAVGSSSTDAKTGATYTVTGVSDDGKVEVSYDAATKTTKKVKIPSTVTLEDGTTATVTSIADNSFKGNKKLTDVTVPSTVEEIGDGAFSGCKSLKNLKIKGNNLEEIGNSAFQNCTKLKKAKLPKSVEKIGKKAFDGDKVAVTITGNKVKSIGKKAFDDAASVKVPAQKKAAYTKLLKKSGYKGTVK